MLTYIIVKFANCVRYFLNFFGKKATSLPGKIALKLKPDILKTIAKDYNVILVTGTNGKTQTTSFVKNILNKKYDFVIYNKEGANLIQGIVTMFLNYYKKSNSKEKFAVLEVDEATVKYVTEYINPKAIILTNVFIDQTERFSNIKITFDKILDGIKKTKDTKIILNADCPVFLSEKIENECIYYGFDNQDFFEKYPNTDECNCPKCNSKLEYNFVTYSNLGDYFCKNCDFKRTVLNYSVDKIYNLEINCSKFSINKNDFAIKKGGIYNIYNSLAAYCCAKVLNIEDDIIQDAFLNSEEIFGRQMVLEIENKKVVVYLMKNPTGANQLFSLIEFEKDPFTLVALLNNNCADGINFKWIENAKFEKLKNTNYKKIFLGGMKKEALKERFLKADFNESEINLIENNTTDILNIIKNSKENKIVIVTTYTNLSEMQKYFEHLNYIKKSYK